MHTMNEYFHSLFLKVDINLCYGLLICAFQYRLSSGWPPGPVLRAPPVHGQISAEAAQHPL